MIETNWIILTGAASSGKSTLLEHLNRDGYQIEKEMARIYINELYGPEAEFEDVPWNSMKFQKGMLDRTVQREKQLDPQDIIIFDRGLYDCYAYNFIQRMNLQELYVEHLYRYKAVFLIKRLPVVHDKIRRETSKQVALQEKVTQYVYRRFEYDLINVPVFTTDPKSNIEKRLVHIKNILNSLLR